MSADSSIKVDHMANAAEFVAQSQGYNNSRNVYIDFKNRKFYNFINAGKKIWDHGESRMLFIVT